ncbi:hypothetical protein WR25_08066 [Diploscapter pachys]|uniref:C-type lectin domain-containing protein n=1 Tax=Diploscapter pachys TaxID=2018661 RepID=A0A2A2J4B2_9BILA|nr:hypothetical protein WR25_08066 [Diploscapter pachys]
MTPVVCVEQNARNAIASHRDANAKCNNHNIYGYRSYRHDHQSYRYNHRSYRYDYRSYRYDHQSHYYDHNSNNDYSTTTRLTHYMKQLIISEVTQYTIGSGGNYYTMEQYKAGACNTFHSGAEPASFTSQEQWDYLVGADNKIVVDQPLWIGLEFDAAGNLAWINGQYVSSPF